jgi:hypothetical protein
MSFFVVILTPVAGVLLTLYYLGCPLLLLSNRSNPEDLKFFKLILRLAISFAAIPGSVMIIGAML